MHNEDRVNGDKAVLINIVLHGLKGPVDNTKYPDVMPAQEEHTDAYIASVLSYIRNSFGNKQRVVSVDDVKEIILRPDTLTVRECTCTNPENM